MMRLLSRTGLRYNDDAIVAGAQTERRGVAGPVSVLLRGGNSPAAAILVSFAPLRAASVAERVPLLRTCQAQSVTVTLPVSVLSNVSVTRMVWPPVVYSVAPPEKVC